MNGMDRDFVEDTAAVCFFEHIISPSIMESCCVSASIESRLTSHVGQLVYYTYDILKCTQCLNRYLIYKKMFASFLVSRALV